MASKLKSSFVDLSGLAGETVCLTRTKVVLQDVLGKGGFGVVHKGVVTSFMTSTSLGRLVESGQAVAVKIVSPPSLHIKKFRAKL